MAPNKYGGQSNMADITKTSNISHIEQNHIKLTTDKAQDNTYINIRAKTQIKSNLIYKFWFVIYGKPKQIRQTTQFF